MQTPTLFKANRFAVILRHGAMIESCPRQRGDVVSVDAATARRLVAAGVGELQDPDDLGPLIALAGADEPRQVFTR
jgi:hypothetical protein